MRSVTHEIDILILRESKAGPVSGMANHYQCHRTSAASVQCAEVVTLQAGDKRRGLAPRTTAQTASPFHDARSSLCLQMSSNERTIASTTRPCALCEVTSASREVFLLLPPPPLIPGTRLPIHIAAFKPGACSFQSSQPHRSCCSSLCEGKLLRAHHSSRCLCSPMRVPDSGLT
jgi:hypothetical protein